MYLKRNFVLIFLLLALLSVYAYAGTYTYDGYFRNFIESKAVMMRKDELELSQVVDSWDNEMISRTEAVGRLEEFEFRAERYMTSVMELRPPEGYFDKYRLSVYAFVTWYNVVGLFVEGFSDSNLEKLDAASTLWGYFDERNW